MSASIMSHHSIPLLYISMHIIYYFVCVIITVHIMKDMYNYHILFCMCNNYSMYYEGHV